MASGASNKSSGDAQAARRDSRRRAGILHAAERLLQHYGFAKTTVADIAREAKVGVGTVYLEFASKNAIVAELAARRYRCVMDAMRQAAAGEGNAAKRLRGLFDARIAKMSKFAKKGQHGQDLVQCRCPDTRAAHAAFRRDEEDLVTDFLQKATSAGELAVAEPRHTAQVLLRIYDSYTAAMSTAPRAASLRQELTTAHDLVLRGLLPRATKNK